MNIKTTNENQYRPAAEAADSRLAKAQSALADAQAELADARQKLADHEAKAETTKTKPRNWATDGAELSAAITWFERMVSSRTEAVATAQAEANEAGRALALAQMQDRAEAIGSFDRAEFIRRYTAKLAPIANEAWEELNAVTDLEKEIASIARTAGIDNSHPRYSVPSGGMGEHVFDGIRLNPGGLTSSTVEEAFKVPDDPRVVARRDAHQAALRDERETQRQAEAQAQAEWEAGAADREAYARFKTAHDNWYAERILRARAFETTADMRPEPVFADPATW